MNPSKERAEDSGTITGASEEEREKKLEEKVKTVAQNQGYTGSISNISKVNDDVGGWSKECQWENSNKTYKLKWWCSKQLTRGKLFI